jgi:hypothetical protein
LSKSAPDDRLSGAWDQSCDTDRMLVVRGTKKLRDRVRVPVSGDDPASTTVLGDWFATAVFWKPQIALLVNRHTLVPVFMPLSPVATLLDRVPDAIAAVLRRHGAGDAFVDSELEAMSEARIAPTNDRSVLGVMNEFAFHGKLHWQHGTDTLEDLSIEMAAVGLARLVPAAIELASALGYDIDRALEEAGDPNAADRSANERNA